MSNIAELKNELNNLISFSIEAKKELDERKQRVTDIVNEIQNNDDKLFVQAPIWIKDGAKTSEFILSMPEITVTRTVDKIGA